MIGSIATLLHPYPPPEGHLPSNPPPLASPSPLQLLPLQLLPSLTLIGAGDLPKGDRTIQQNSVGFVSFLKANDFRAGKISSDLVRTTASAKLLRRGAYPKR